MLVTKVNEVPCFCDRISVFFFASKNPDFVHFEIGQDNVNVVILRGASVMNFFEKKKHFFIICRMMLNRCAFESRDLGASFELCSTSIRHFPASLWPHEKQKFGKI